MRDYAYILIIAAAVTYLLTPLVRRGSIAIGAMHAARSRDVHTEPTPLLGGVAMYIGFAAGLLVAERLSYLRSAFPTQQTGHPSTVTGLLLAGGLLVLVGIVDDRFGMGAISKLAAQIAAGGILIWSGVYLPWIPLPGGNILSLEPDLSATLTILIIVITVNAVNFIDGLDGLAAGVVAIAALSYLVYVYNLANSVGIPSQTVPALESAVLAGICIGFLPHNFHPARIFMGDTGAMLLGLLLAYGPISSLASLDPNILINYSHLAPVNRYPTILPLLLPVAILIIPYADFLLAVIRRTAAGKSPLDADRRHLHHRLMNMGHSHRQSVLLMYLWAALFSGTVVGLSQFRIRLIWLAVATAGAMLVLLVATMPRLRPWRYDVNGKVNGKQPTAAGSRVRPAEAAGIPVYGAAVANVSVADHALRAGSGPAVSTASPPPTPGAVPGGKVPGGAAPAYGALPAEPPPPNGSVPGRPVPRGVAPGGAAPANGVVRGGAVPGGVVPGGAVPGGVVPGALPAYGAQPREQPPSNGTAPSASAATNGTFPTSPLSPNAPWSSDDPLPPDSPWSSDASWSSDDPLPPDGAWSSDASWSSDDPLPPDGPWSSNGPPSLEGAWSSNGPPSPEGAWSPNGPLSPDGAWSSDDPPSPEGAWSPNSLLPPDGTAPSNGTLSPNGAVPPGGAVPQDDTVARRRRTTPLPVPQATL